VFLVLVISVLCVVKAQNYCDNSLCNGNQHIACRHSGVRTAQFVDLQLN
jgi:hypothetical protein